MLYLPENLGEKGEQKIRARTPTGRLIKKTVDQLKCLTKKPESAGPIVGASNIGNPRRPIIEPRFSIGIILNDIPIPIGATTPPVKPWAILQIIRLCSEWALAARNEAIVKKMIAKAKTFYLKSGLPKSSKWNNCGHS